MKWHITQHQARHLLETSASSFAELMRRGTMSVELFAPQGTDTQEPHKQDELYIILTGRAEFVKAGQRVNCAAGDVLFVEAGTVHRFERFSDDFQTFVIFASFVVNRYLPYALMPTQPPGRGSPRRRVQSSPPITPWR